MRVYIAYMQFRQACIYICNSKSEPLLVFLSEENANNTEMLLNLVKRFGDIDSIYREMKLAMYIKEEPRIFSF